MTRDLILLNSSHYVGNNKYSFKFPQAITFDKNSTISLHSLSIYNSTYNITSAFGNNTFSIVWLGTTYNFVMPDGYYTTSDIDYYIKQQMILNGLYCTTSNDTQNVYFISLRNNEVRYKCEISIYYIPTQTEATTNNFTKATNATWDFPLSSTSPQLNLSSGLARILGFNQLSFPSTITNTNQTFLSNIAPQISPIYSYIITCNLCYSKFNNVNDVFTQVPITKEFGSLIEVNANNEQKTQINPGIYNEIHIQLWTQNYDILEFNDKDMTMMLIIETI